MLQRLPKVVNVHNRRLGRLSASWQSLASNFRAFESTKSFPAPSTQPKTVFSGIQPTGVPHIGNYLGALRPWVQLQNEAKSDTRLFFSVVDLHSLTAIQEPLARRASKRAMYASLLAVGLNPQRSTIFHQSAVSAHAELHWILSCNASMGGLARMTQWKSKIGDTADIASLLAPSPNPKSEERLKLGLYSYPVLQAADILLYQTTHVPVGEDQAQHVEFARSTAQTFNSIYGRGEKLLRQPECLVSPAKRVMSLIEPHRKMSKSHTSEKSRILISDMPEEIMSKVKSAKTDSLDGITYDPVNRPGISNLIDIMSHLDGSGRACDEIVLEFENSTFLAFKEVVAKRIIDHLAPIRDRYRQLLDEKNENYLDNMARDGASKARNIAEDTMQTVRDAIGL